MRRWPWILLAVLVSAVAVVAWGVRRRADLEWERMSANTARRLAEIEERSALGPSDRARAEPGDAWEAYGRALAAAEQLPDDLDEDLESFADRRPDVDPRPIVARLREAAAILDDLRLGARRTGIVRTRDWSKGMSMGFPGLLGARRIAYLAACHARILDEEGRFRGAAEILLDVLTLGDDLGRGGVLLEELVGEAVGHIGALGLRHLVSRLGAEELLETARRIERLESTRPRIAQALWNDFVAAGITIETEGNVGGSGTAGDVLASWRYGFSPRLAGAIGVNELHGLADRARETDRASWIEARCIAEEIEREAESSPNWLVRMCFPGLMVETERAYLARLRLIRLAAAWRATGQVPAVEDPFGDTLRSSVSAGTLRAWSVGADGADDGGAGDWTGGADLVLEVPGH